MYKRIDKFLLIDILKVLKKCSIGFYIDDIKPYNKALASIRIRCYDIIQFLCKQGIEAELFKPFKKYQIVVFTKTNSDRAVKKARKLHDRGIKICFETFCEYLDDESIQNREKENIKSIMQVADCVITASSVQKEMFEKYHKNVKMISESVHQDFFTSRKQHINKEEVTLVYCGYADKAKDTLCIADVIKRLQKEYRCKILFLCEKDPQVSEFNYEYQKYDQKKIPQQLLEGDIMIAPRPMEGIEKRSHSFTKVAYPLAVGLPAVASPMPSYLGTPVIICNTENEWYIALKDLITNTEKRTKNGLEGQKYVYDIFSVEVIGKEYITLFKSMVSIKSSN